MIHLGLPELVDKVRFRFPRQKDQKDLLPTPASFSPADAIDRLACHPDHSPEGTRRSMGNQLLLLQRAFGGRPEILFWHALAISYLRRDTPHTKKAAELFFKIWDEQAEWMATNLNGRWLISALQTFADHGRDADEIRCGSVGYVYGSLIKIYECEIASAYDRKPATGPFRGGAVPGLFEFQPGDDVLFNLNTLVAAQGEHAGPAGYALGSLMAQVKASQSVFVRTDALATDRADAFFAFTGKRRSG
ncbi:hypothetical protein JI664_23175 [Rhodobacter sp. NTK016B]|uniref:hypothetical protein n=1 Tax=Rhodobacter sp. NTK016B TaxID=2759676 RepID=UPI001A905BBA|nr:hypothetical protein [Rhodobacter sp. NTK016B]MBN8294892.1 hypothetical protein [Rhodobacter sp. NTK016B]